jgi:hypothetical protein
MENVGFIILRHVNNDNTNKYWQFSYDSIRKYYPENKIIIIDDNSNYEFITEKKLYKTTIIQSEYPKRGELLPYYYYLHNKLFDTAVIIHDSVFINRYINFTVDKYKFIWEFEHDWDNDADEKEILKTFDDKELLSFYENKNLWKGCFGGMSIITHDYLVFINNKYNISKLLDYIISRDRRMAFERVIAVLLQKHGDRNTLLGNLHKYCGWGSVNYDKIDNVRHLPIIKVWTGR